MKNTLTKITLLFICFSFLLFGQKDSVSIIKPNFPDSVFTMVKSPWGAVLKSAILPGYGQYYNKSYIKIPIIWGALGWCGYNWLQNNSKYNDYSSLVLNPQPGFTVARYQLIRDFYRDQRDLFAIYFVLTYIANLVDAYVDAHLFDFDVTEDFFRNTTFLNIKLKL